MNEFLAKYLDHFRTALDSVTVTGSQSSYEAALTDLVAQLKKVQAAGGKVMMAGNGGSAAICSHQATDYWKNGNVRATAFNDSSLLTCISNDYSYEEVFSVPVKMFAEKGDLLFCISSSGSSRNILNAAEAGKTTGCRVVTFSGFDGDNPLRGAGDLNFHVKSHSYGAVEIIHLFIIHSILDAFLTTEGIDVFHRNKPLKS